MTKSQIKQLTDEIVDLKELVQTERKHRQGAEEMCKVHALNKRFVFESLVQERIDLMSRMIRIDQRIAALAYKTPVADEKLAFKFNGELRKWEKMLNDFVEEGERVWVKE